MKDLQHRLKANVIIANTHEGIALNVQTERLENHSARLTVEVPQERYEKARDAAIKTVSKKVNVPGFRKGKVPASIVLKYVGEAYILEEIMESLGQAVYKEALDIAGVEPAASGSMDDFKTDPNITFIYTVPLAPEVVLPEDYRDIRFDYSEPTVGEAEVETELRAFQREFGETVDSEAPAAAGDRITADLHSFFVTPETTEDSAETDVHDREEEPYVHRHGAVLDLNEGEDEPLAPGFTANVVGANVGDTRVFRITFPETSDKLNEELLGKTVEFVVTIEKIQKVTVPALDDALAAKISERYGWENLGEDDGETLSEAVERLAAEGEELVEGEPVEAAEGEEAAPAERVSTPLTLEQVRGRVLETIDERTKKQAREAYANKVLEKVIEGSSVTFNEASVEAEIDDMLEDFKNRLSQNRLTLDLYLKSSGQSLEDIRSEYRAPAETRLRRSLAVREFADKEGLRVSQEDLTERLMSVFTDIGPEVIQQMGLLNNQEFTANMINSLMSQKIEERAIAIGRGEALDLNTASEEPAIVASESEAPAADSPDAETTTETEQ